MMSVAKRSGGAIDDSVPYYFMLRCGLDTFDLGIFILVTRVLRNW